MSFGERGDGRAARTLSLSPARPTRGRPRFPLHGLAREGAMRPIRWGEVRTRQQSRRAGGHDGLSAGAAKPVQLRAMISSAVSA